MMADAAGCGGSALPLQPTNALASSSTAAPKNSRATRARPFWVIDGFMNSLLKAELDADTCGVDVAVEAVHASPRMIPVQACAPRAGKTPGRREATEKLSGGHAAGDCWRRTGLKVRFDRGGANSRTQRQCRSQRPGKAHSAAPCAHVGATVKWHSGRGAIAGDEVAGGEIPGC